MSAISILVGLCHFTTAYQLGGCHWQLFDNIWHVYQQTIADLRCNDDHWQTAKPTVSHWRSRVWLHMSHDGKGHVSTRAKHAITSGNTVGISNSFRCLNRFHRRRLTCLTFEKSRFPFVVNRLGKTITAELLRCVMNTPSHRLTVSVWNVSGGNDRTQQNIAILYAQLRWLARRRCNGEVLIWLGLLTCENRLPYNLYRVGGDVKPCSIQSNLGLTLLGLKQIGRPIAGMMVGSLMVKGRGFVGIRLRSVC